MTQSIAEEFRKELEARGEYVVRANAASGWFAMFPKTWLKRSEAAKRDGRAGPNLVVYRTNSMEPRAHYVIPHRVITDLLDEATLTTSSVDGVRRWNLTLKGDALHVSHRPGVIPVAQFRGDHLLTEAAARPLQLSVDESSTASPRDWSAAARQLGRGVGAGFSTDAEANRRVERAAVVLVSDKYRKDGWRVESVELEKCGFDLRCLREGEELHVEVKGVAGTARQFVLTAGEYKRACSDKQFVLALVTAATSERPELELLSGGTLITEFRFEPLQYSAVPKET